VPPNLQLHCCHPSLGSDEALPWQMHCSQKQQHTLAAMMAEQLGDAVLTVRFRLSAFFPLSSLQAQAFCQLMHVYCPRSFTSLTSWWPPTERPSSLRSS
jgi:hypothetical protein